MLRITEEQLSQLRALPIEGVAQRDRPFLNEAARQFLFDERKLNEKEAGWCRLNSYTDKQGTPWFQIPYYDIDGNLIGVQSRNLSYQPHPLICETPQLDR